MKYAELPLNKAAVENHIKAFYSHRKTFNLTRPTKFSKKDIFDQIEEYWRNNPGTFIPEMRADYIFFKIAMRAAILKQKSNPAMRKLVSKAINFNLGNHPNAK